MSDTAERASKKVRKRDSETSNLVDPMVDGAGVVVGQEAEGTIS